MMDKIKQKLSSRKFILAVVMIILLGVLFFFSDSITASQSALLTKVIIVIVAYIFGESFVDGMAAFKKYDTDNDNVIDPDEFANIIVDTVIGKLNEKSNSTQEETK